MKKFNEVTLNITVAISDEVHVLTATTDVWSQLTIPDVLNGDLLRLLLLMKHVTSGTLTIPNHTLYSHACLLGISKQLDQTIRQVFLKPILSDVPIFHTCTSSPEGTKHQ